MPQFDDDFDDDDDFGDEQPDSGRSSNLVNDLRKQRNQFGKENKSLKAQLAQLTAQVRERNVADVLSSKGINPKVAKFIPTDVDTSVESIEGWINDYADVFGFQLAKPAAEQAPEVADPQAAQTERMRQAEEAGQPNTGDVAIQSRIAAAGTEAELMQMLQQYGGRAV